MTTETVAKKIDELRVADLKVALEERSLDTHGNKIDLVKRLKQDLIEKGLDPETHEFQLPKAAPQPKRQRANSATVKPDADASNGLKDEAEDDGEDETMAENVDSVADATDAVEQPEDNEVAAEDVDTADRMDELAEGDEVVDEVGEVDEAIEVPDFEDAEEPSSVSLETSNAMDNEDSLNLTIGEDEEKIFQDEETDGKQDEGSEDNTANNATDAESTIENKSSTNGATGAVVVTSTSGASGTNNATASDSASPTEKTNGTTAGDSVENKGGVKTEDSEAKSSSSNKTSSAKEDKESSSAKNSASMGASTANSKSKATSSSSSSSSASRNLWVSGLSSLTRATDLKMIFSKHGKVVGAKVVTNTRTPYTRCYGYVTMGSSADATKCIEQLNRIELHGRIVTVERAKSDMAGVKSVGDSPSTSVKTEDDTQGKDKSTTAEKTASNKDGAEPTDGDDKKKRSADSSKSAAGGDPKGPRDNGRPKRGVSRDRDGGPSSNGAAGHRRPPPGKGRPVTDREREVLSFQKIREERERQRLRERERKVREEERRRQDARRRQREEEERLARERERLKKERVRLEREKADLLRLERERQKLEREKIELERLELKRQQMKIEEAKRAIKRPSDHDRFPEVDRKRPAPDRRFEPPPPPRFDTSISRAAPYVEKKRVDDYAAPAKGRDDYAAKRDSFKRPVNDYVKREDVVPRASNAYDSRNSAPANKDRYGVAPSDSRPNSSFPGSGRGGRDDRGDVRNVNAPKSRYVDGGSSGDNRYSDRSSGSSSWPNSGGPSSSSAKTFSSGGGNHIQSVGGGGGADMWNQKQTDSNWRSMDQNQDRYDRTYNERKSQAAPGQYISAPPSRQNSYVGRPQDRGYNTNNNMSSRFDNNRF